LWGWVLPDPFVWFFVSSWLYSIKYTQLSNNMNASGVSVPQDHLLPFISVPIASETSNALPLQ
jgi:hypothetical protein